MLIASKDSKTRGVRPTDFRLSVAFFLAILGRHLLGRRCLPRLDIQTGSPILCFMLDTALLASIALQMMTGTSVDLNGARLPVRHTSAQRLRTLSFVMDGRQYQAIEQNPEKPSRWGRLARDGHQVVQFKDVVTNKFVAVVVDDKVSIYGAGG
jgi:hypothetical protein